MPAFSTFDAIASATRKEVDAAICEGIHDRMSMPERAGLLRLLEERESDGTTQAARRNTPCRWAGACRRRGHQGDLRAGYDGAEPPSVAVS